MSQPIPSPRSSASGGRSPASDVRQDLWVPTLVRAVVALMFGAVTIFWQRPTQDGAPWAIGLFLLGTGAAWLLLQWRLSGRNDVDLGATGPVPQWLGILYALGGVLILFVDAHWLTVLLTAVVLGLSGVGELALGLRHREFPLGKDWTLSGLLTVAAGTGVMLVESLGPKAELGMVGGVAIIIGVTQVIAALSLRHDARSVGAAGSPQSGPTRRVD